MKEGFNGKAIYNPSGAAGEYSYWACNFFKGCSNLCEYCYLKKGIWVKTLGGDKPELKACFKDQADAIRVFEKELLQNVEQLRIHGLYFTFTSDPFLNETKALTMQAVEICLKNGVPVKLLTKCPKNAILEFNGAGDLESLLIKNAGKIGFGVTLTGFNELEPGADTHGERIIALNKFKCNGFKTFASIEPVIEFDKSFSMIDAAILFTDLFKVGLLSGKKFARRDVVAFIEKVHNLFESRIYQLHISPKLYWKESILKAAGIKRDSLPWYCIGRDYDLFNS
jgi:DNA repair photolyase